MHLGRLQHLCGLECDVPVLSLPTTSREGWHDARSGDPEQESIGEEGTGGGESKAKRGKAEDERRGAELAICEAEGVERWGHGEALVEGVVSGRTDDL